jgi:hypothetical protein
MQAVESWPQRFLHSVREIGLTLVVSMTTTLFHCVFLPSNTSSCLIYLCPAHTTMHIGPAGGRNGAESLCTTGYEKFTSQHAFKKGGSNFSCRQMLIQRLLFVF